MACGEEVLPSFDHLGAVSRARHEIHVALARDVEGMTLRAAQLALALLELAPADRAPEQVDGRREHRGILAVMKVIRNDELPTGAALASR